MAKPGPEESTAGIGIEETGHGKMRSAQPPYHPTDRRLGQEFTPEASILEVPEMSFLCQPFDRPAKAMPRSLRMVGYRDVYCIA